MFAWIKNFIDKMWIEIKYRKRLKEVRKKDPYDYT